MNHAISKCKGKNVLQWELRTASQYLREMGGENYETTSSQEVRSLHLNNISLMNHTKIVLSVIDKRKILYCEDLECKSYGISI